MSRRKKSSSLIFLCAKCLILFTLLSPLYLEASHPSVLFIIDCPPKKLATWNDGFIAATRLLAKDYEVDFYNLNMPHDCNFAQYDVVLVKSNWNCGPDQFARRHIPDNIPKALLISGVNEPPSLDKMFFYDLLFYETDWYWEKICAHPHVIHAFGVNTEVMKKPQLEIPKIYDYISVGEFKPEKRYELFAKKTGTKLAVGLIYDWGNPIIKNLKKNNVLVLDFISYEELAQLYCQSRCCYIGSTIDGGGERAVLEARSCGLQVIVEEDNPKLQKLINSPIYDHHYYYNQLKKGIESLLPQEGKV